MSNKKSEDLLSALKVGKKINSELDGNVGISISTRLPGVPEPTKEEKEEARKRLEIQRKIHEEQYRKFSEEHPTPDLQMDKLLELIKGLEEKVLDRETLEKMKKIIIQTKEDYLEYYLPEY